MLMQKGKPNRFDHAYKRMKGTLILTNAQIDLSGVWSCLNLSNVERIMRKSVKDLSPNCRCGKLYRLSQSYHNILEFDRTTTTFKIDLKGEACFSVQFCPMCGDHDLYEWQMDYEHDVFKICACGIKNDIDSGKFASSIMCEVDEVFSALYSLRLGESEIKFEDEILKTEKIQSINSCFRCGGRLFSRITNGDNDERFRKSVKPSKQELTEIYEKLKLVKNMQDVFREFGEPEEIINADYYGTSAEMTEYSKVLRESLYYTNKYKTIEFSIDHYFDGTIGYTLTSVYEPK